MVRGPPKATGVRRFLTLDEQRGWIDGSSRLRDSDERLHALEHRFKYIPRFEKFLRRPQAQDALAILKLYAERCLPMPRRTEREFWSVSCLPSTSDKPLARVNASWMELFTLYADGDGIRARVILHLSDFTTDRSTAPGHLDQAFLEHCAGAPEHIGHAFPRGEDMLIVTVRGVAAIREFLANDRALRGIRRFNLTHMNRGRNAYQASHCYSVADQMVGG